MKRSVYRHSCTSGSVVSMLYSFFKETVLKQEGKNGNHENYTRGSQTPPRVTGRFHLPGCADGTRIRGRTRSRRKEHSRNGAGFFWTDATEPTLCGDRTSKFRQGREVHHRV